MSPRQRVEQLSLVVLPGHMGGGILVSESGAAFVGSITWTRGGWSPRQREWSSSRRTPRSGGGGWCSWTCTSRWTAPSHEPKQTIVNQPSQSIIKQPRQPI